METPTCHADSFGLILHRIDFVRHQKDIFKQFSRFLDAIIDFRNIHFRPQPLQNIFFIFGFRTSGESPTGGLAIWRCKATLFWVMLLFLRSNALGGPGPLVGVRVGEARNLGPGMHRFDIAEPDWSEHELDAEDIQAPAEYLEEISVDEVMDTGGSPPDLNKACADNAFPSPNQVEAWLEAEKALGIKDKTSTPASAQKDRNRSSIDMELNPDAPFCASRNPEL